MEVTVETLATEVQQASAEATVKIIEAEADATVAKLEAETAISEATADNAVEIVESEIKEEISEEELWQKFSEVLKSVDDLRVSMLEQHQIQTETVVLEISKMMTIVQTMLANSQAVPIVAASENPPSSTPENLPETNPETLPQNDVEENPVPKTNRKTKRVLL